MVILVSITIFLVFEAVDRVLTPGEIDADMMMFTAIIGLIFNLIQMGILHDDEGHDGHDHGNMNVN